MGFELWEAILLTTNWRNPFNRAALRRGWGCLLVMVGICALLFCGAAGSSAQTTSSISGTVKDETGALIPKAKVVLVNQSSGGKRSLEANAEGFFYFAAVPPGTYRVEVSYKGFESWKVTDVTVHPGDNLTIPKINLLVGAVEDSVVVTAEVAGVALDSGEHSTLITSTQIQRLSTVGRDAGELISILPGFAVNATDASNTGLSYQNAGFGTNNMGSFGANGAAPQSGMTAISADGASLIDPGDMGGTLASVNMDQVEEVKVQTSNFGADVARGPIVINAVGKSGGTEYHGSIYTYMRNYAANANDWVSNYFGTARPTSRYLYPGGSVGGPVRIPGTNFNKSKKLIFWAGYESYRQAVPQALLKAFVPPGPGSTYDMLDGDLSVNSIASALNVTASDLQDPNKGCTSYASPGTLFQNMGGLCYTPTGVTDQSGNQVTGGIIKDIDPGIAAYERWYPKPNRTPQPVTNALGAETAATDGINYVRNQMTTQNGYQFHSRVDANFSDNLKLYGTYNWEKVNAVSQLGAAWYGPVGLSSNIQMPTPYNSNTYSHYLTLNLTKTLSASSTNELVLAGVYFNNPGQYADLSKVETQNTAWQAAGYDGGVRADVLYGQNSTASKVGDHFLPGIGGWEGVNMPTYGAGYVDPKRGQYLDKMDVTLSDNLTRIYRTHSIKAGFYAEQTINNGINLGSDLNGYMFFMRWDSCLPNMTTNYNGAEPKSFSMGNEWGNFLTGCPLSAGQDTSDPASNLGFKTIEGYVTDEWKVNSRLTLTLGIRLSHLSPWTDRHGIGIAVFEPSQLQEHVLLSTLTQDPKTWTGFSWHQKDPSIPTSGIPSRALFYAPRFSLAYDLYGNGKTTLRGGWGAYHSHEGLFYVAGSSMPLGLQSWNMSSAGTACTFAQMYSNDSTIRPCGYYTASSVSSQMAPFTVSANDPHDDRSPVTYNYNFTVDQALPRKVQFELAYVGNQSTDLSTLANLQNQNVVPLGAYFGPDPAIGSAEQGQVQPLSNIPSNMTDYRPYPNYYQINVPTHKAWSNYNALQASLNRQTGAIAFGVNYTWSKALAVRGSWDTGSIADPVNMHHDYGIASYDRRQVINGTYSWQEGTLYHGHRSLRPVLNGWEMSGILQVASGPDLSVLNGYGTNYGLSGGATYYASASATTAQTLQVNSSSWLGSSDYTLQPTVTCNPALGLNKRLHQYVNGSCFGLPAPGSQGVWNLPYVQGPKFFKWDTTLFKDFKVRDKQSMQFRLAAFNVLNHPLISFSGQDPSNPLTLNVGDPSDSHYTSIQDALSGITVMNTGSYQFGQTKFKAGGRILEGSVKYNF
jgi:hypothetical protein